MNKIFVASAAMVATAYGQDSEEPTLNVSQETIAIENATDKCETSMGKYMAKLSDSDKMQVAVKAMRVVSDALTMAKESSYTKDEKAHRMRHCDQKKMNAKERKLCKYMAGSLIKEGKINYMTLKGRRALDDICKVQHDVADCRYSCKLIKDFWKKPTAADCELVLDEWKEECLQRASGEISHDGNTHEEIEQGAKHRAVIGVCRKNYNEEITKCQNEYDKMLKKILKQKGNVPRNDSRQIGSCYYKQLKNFSNCVKTAPEAPEGLEFKRNRPQSGGALARDFMKSIMDVAKQFKKDYPQRGRKSQWGKGRGRGRVSPNDWNQRGRTNTRNRRRRRVEPKVVPPQTFDEEEVERNEPIEENEERMRIFEFGDD